jgi:hypothetical protein
MSESKHTPGPWEVDPPGHPLDCHGILDADELGLAETHGREGKGEEEANAHLIAAAPEMYEALEELVNSEANVDPDETYSDKYGRLDMGKGAAIRKAQAALKKALGPNR